MPYFRPYVYIKDESFDPIYKPINKSFYLKFRIVPFSIFLFGFFILFSQILLPLVEFKTKDKVSRPIASSVLGYATGFQEFEYKELSDGLGTIKNGEDTNMPKYFYLSIPKLNIKNALVETNAPDLNPDEALGHYDGSKLPGENGNSFIYGHSVLPVFYNPKNYKTIFSTLHLLEVGDKFMISYNNKTYEYIVYEKEVLSPQDVNPLANIKPKYLNESTITLMTCSPPGTKFRRLLVKATLTNF